MKKWILPVITGVVGIVGGTVIGSQFAEEVEVVQEAEAFTPLTCSMAFDSAEDVITGLGDVSQLAIEGWQAALIDDLAEVDAIQDELDLAIEDLPDYREDFDFYRETCLEHGE